MATVKICVSPLPHDDEYYRNLDQTTVDWELARKDFSSTGSGLAVLCGLSAYKEKRSNMVKYKKTNTEKKHSQFVIDNIFSWGKNNEKNGRHVLEEYFTEIGKQNEFIFSECGIQPALTKTGVHIGASPDGILRDKETNEIKHVVEIKCPYSRNFGKYGGIDEYIEYVSSEENIHHLTPSITDTVNLRIPAEYFIQIQMQLFATGTRTGYFVGWTPHCSFVLEIPFHQRLWEEHFEPKCDEFYLEVKDKIKPVDDKKVNKEGKELKKEIDNIQDVYNKLVYLRIDKPIDL